MPKDGLLFSPPPEIATQTRVQKPMTEEEYETFMQLEVFIEHAHRIWIQVGQAFRVIASKEFYRRDYAGFEEYVMERWPLMNIKEIYASMWSSRTLEMMAKQDFAWIPEGNYRIAKQLAWFENKERILNIWKEVLRHFPEPPTRDNKLSMRYIRDVDKKLRARPEPLEDSKGHLIPQDMERQWKRDEWARAEVLVRNARKIIERMDAKHTIWCGDEVDKWIEQLKDLETLFLAQRPYVVCQQCHGGGCIECQHVGYLTKLIYVERTGEEPNGSHDQIRETAIPTSEPDFFDGPRLHSEGEAQDYSDASDGEREDFSSGDDWEAAARTWHDDSRASPSEGTDFPVPPNF